MKTVHAMYPNFSTVIQDMDGHSLAVTFVQHLATMPTEFAEAICHLRPDRFEIVGGDGTETVTNTKGRGTLIVRNMGLGDVLLATPVARRLKETKKADWIGFATKRIYLPLLANNPYIDMLIALEDGYRPEEWTYVIDLCGKVEHAENSQFYRNRVKAFCDIAEVDIAEGDYQLNFLPDPAAVQRMQKKLAAHWQPWDDRPLVAYVVKASTGQRSLPKTKMRDVLRALVNDGNRVVMLDHECQSQEVVSADILNTCGKISIADVCAMISLCDVIIAPDSGLFHVAQALNKPVVTYFGPFPLAERQSSLNVIDVAPGKKACQLWPCRKYTCLVPPVDGTTACLNLEISDIITGIHEFCKDKQPAAV